MIQILDRFYHGETTIDEERRLIAMLLSDDCPMDLKAERHAVIMLARQEAVSVPDDLEERVLGVIKPQTININRYKWFAAAAVAFLLVGVALWTYLPKPEPSAIPQTSTKAEPIKTAPEKSLSENPVITKGQFSCYNKRTVPLLHDTTDSAVPTEKEQAQPVHEEAMLIANTPHVVYPSEFHQRKHTDSRLTAKVYMSSNFSRTGSFHQGASDISMPITDHEQQDVHHRQPIRFGISLRYRLVNRSHRTSPQRSMAKPLQRSSASTT